MPLLGARILVTDDNEANQRLIGLRLIQAGAEVVTALNGQEALDRVGEAAGTGRPLDAVIIDMQMPVLDGYEAVRRSRWSSSRGRHSGCGRRGQSRDRHDRTRS